MYNRCGNLEGNEGVECNTLKRRVKYSRKEIGSRRLQTDVSDEREEQTSS